MKSQSIIWIIGSYFFISFSAFAFSLPNCPRCGLDSNEIFQSGSIGHRFQATRNISNDIMEQNEVLDMDELIFSDTAAFCPKYRSFNSRNRMDFWSVLLASIAIYESNIRPDVSYDEGQSSRELSGVTSRGLIQMSYDSARQSRYVENGCRLGRVRDLHDPRSNLRCALALMKTLVKMNNCIACGRKKGAAKYWSTLRSPYQIRDTRGRVLNIGKKPKIIDALKKYKPNCF